MQRFAYVLNHVYIWGIMFVLLGAFWMQFYAKEFPCPLCLLQRMCMILAAIGPAYVLLQMREEDDREERLIDVGMGFGMSILAALAGMAVSKFSATNPIHSGKIGGVLGSMRSALEH